MGKPHFGRKNVARFEICPENRNRATKFVGSFRGVLISWQVLAAWCPLQAWCLDGEARGSVAGAGPADRDRGGDRVRERLDHARPAHGVRRALRQEPLRPASQGHSRR